MGEDKIPETENVENEKNGTLKRTWGYIHLLKVRSRETTEGHRRNLERVEVRMVQRHITITGEFFKEMVDNIIKEKD